MSPNRFADMYAQIYQPKIDALTDGLAKARVEILMLSDTCKNLSSSCTRLIRDTAALLTDVDELTSERDALTKEVNDWKERHAKLREALKQECFCTDESTHPSTCEPCIALAQDDID